MDNVSAHVPDAPVEDALEIHPRVLTGARLLGLAIAFVVGAASFKLSFSTLVDLSIMTGAVNPSDAWVIPVALDGPILACAVIRIALSQHTDAATVRGRRLVIAVLAISALLSIAGNAYHAVLTSTPLNAAVAAAIAALAPAMVLTMSEIVAVVLRAPRRRPNALGEQHAVASVSTTPDGDSTVLSTSESQQEGVQQSSSVSVEEDLDNGLLKRAVWVTVHLYLTHPEWSYSDIARHLDVHTSTVSRHIKTWTEVQQKIASDRSVAAPAQDPGPQNDAVGNGVLDSDSDAGFDGKGSDRAYTGAEHEYAALT